MATLKRLAVAAVACSLLAAASPRTAAPTTKPRHRLLGWSDRGLSGGARSFLERGSTPARRLTWRPPDPSAFTPTSPLVLESFEGPTDSLHSPSDSTGAVGPTRYITLVNAQFAIYDRTVSPPELLASGPLASLGGRPPDEEGVFDPQIIWDNETQRFYYAMDRILGQQKRNYQIAFGYSSTANPTTGSDWCHYSTDFNGTYGTSGWFPDYPKLGDMKGYLLIGTNVYNDDEVRFRTDLDWIRKPPATGACLPGQMIRLGTFQDLRNEDGSPALTPVPGNSIDTTQVAYVVAEGDVYDNGPADFITMFSVRRPQGVPVLNGPISLPVATYDIPPPAPQPDGAVSLDTLDGRFTNAVVAADPTFGSRVLWTQHTVAGGAGAEVRWYEVTGEGRGRAGPVVLQSGVISDPSLHVFNAAISSDRVANDDVRAFGDSMVVGFNTSSAVAFVEIQMVSKIGLGPQSGFVSIHASETVDNDFTCFDADPSCRWGDYPGASPDPAADPAGAHGVVWATNMWNRTGEPNYATWGSWNWAASP